MSSKIEGCNSARSAFKCSCPIFERKKLFNVRRVEKVRSQVAVDPYPESRDMDLCKFLMLGTTRLMRKLIKYIEAVYLVLLVFYRYRESESSHATFKKLCLLTLMLVYNKNYMLMV